VGVAAARPCSRRAESRSRLSAFKLARERWLEGHVISSTPLAINRLAISIIWRAFFDFKSRMLTCINSQSALIDILKQIISVPSREATMMDVPPVWSDFSRRQISAQNTPIPSNEI
jgi:hypothetical protein